MGRKVIGIITVLACMFTSHAVAQNCLQESTWQNPSGSMLFIEDISSEGQITGIYINKAAGFGCQNTPYPVTGWALENTNTVTWTVKWENSSENCQSLTSWTGFLSSDCKTITTLWQLVPNGATSTTQILTGSNSFTQLAQKNSTFVQGNSNNQ